MQGEIIDENETHYLIKFFKTGTKYCVKKTTIESKNIIETP